MISVVFLAFLNSILNRVTFCEKTYKLKIKGGNAMKSAFEVGSIIKERRLKMKMTQLKLAKKLFVSEKTVSRWECGDGYPSMYIIEDICSALGLTLNDLLGDEHDYPFEEGLFEALKKKKIKSTLIAKIGIQILFIFLMMLSFIPFDVSTSGISYSLIKNIFIPYQTDWFFVLSIMLFLFVLSKIVFNSIDIYFTVNKKNATQKITFISVLFSFFGAIGSLLFELVPGSNMEMLGFIFFFVFMICFVVECGIIFTNISLNTFDKKPLPRFYWIFASIFSYTLSIGIYLSLIFLALRVIPIGYQVLFNIVSFCFGCAFPFFFAYFILRISKVKNRLFISILLSIGLSLLVVYSLSIFKIEVFQYVMDVLNYVGIIVSPSLSFLILKRVNMYKKEDKLCLLI